MSRNSRDKQDMTESELRQYSRDATDRSTQAWIDGDQAGHEHWRNESLDASRQAYDKYWKSRTGK